MNSTIEKLKEDYSALMKKQSQREIAQVEKLQKEYNLIFEEDEYLKECILNLDNSSEYSLQEDGLYLWTDIGLGDYHDCIPYLMEYLSENHCFSLDLENGCLQVYLGDCYISIQDDTLHGRDNGVWYYGDIVIKESEYTICPDCKENNCSEHLGAPEVNEKLRNQLIEKYMDKQGEFPCVGRVTQQGDFFLVLTCEVSK